MLVPPASTEPLFVDSASPAGMPAVEHGNLAALEGDDVKDLPSQRRVGLVLVVLLVLAVAALAASTFL